MYPMIWNTHPREEKQRQEWWGYWGSWLECWKRNSTRTKYFFASITEEDKDVSDLLISTTIHTNTRIWIIGQIYISFLWTFDNGETSTEDEEIGASKKWNWHMLKHQQYSWSTLQLSGDYLLTLSLNMWNIFVLNS